MKRKTFVIVGVVLAVILLILVIGGTWFVRRPWSKVKGTVSVTGLSAPVQIIRDEWGVPHIFAENEHDLFFAQGYVHAQDRLWQMEFNRRVASGTLSAILGPSTLDTDRFLRTIGLRRAAEKDWALVEDETRLIMQAYADGVNAYVESHRGRLPLEFTILGVDPAPWTPVDTLSWGKVMSLDLGGNYKTELFRARLIADLGEEATRQLMPPYPDEAPFIIPPEARSYAWLQNAPSVQPDPLYQVLGDLRLEWGSNNWVVHGSRTATGKPLLADDMHLGLNMPAIWYENGLHGGRFDVIGYSFPGVPMVIVGHNDQIAWAVTNLGPDVQDMYIEQLNDPIQPTRYKFMGEWQDLEIVEEVIEVKGESPVTVVVRQTHHGPIMNDVIQALQDGEPMALQWTALEGSYLFKAVQGIDLASNWEEFRQALTFWDVPSQNFVYADREGNIGYQSPGRIPIRVQGHQGLVPVPGWTGDYEWQGFIPFEELPSVFNPPTGFVATANNKVVPDDYPYHLAYEWAAPYRAQRITDLLKADDSITLEDMQRIHAQTYSIPAEVFRPSLLGALGELEDPLEAEAISVFENWDLYLETDRPGATIYETWYWFFVYNTLQDELGEDLIADYVGNVYIHVPMMIDLVAQNQSHWFNDIGTPGTEGRDDMMRRSFSDAVSWLANRLGDDPAQWEWGKLHTMTLVHQPLGQSGISLLETLFNSKTIPARGDNLTVDAASYSFSSSGDPDESPFAMEHGASQRLIVDLSDLENSLSVHTTGQSGQLFHPHREDFVQLWQNVGYHPLFFSRELVEANADAVLTLEPQ